MTSTSPAPPTRSDRLVVAPAMNTAPPTAPPPGRTWTAQGAFAAGLVAVALVHLIVLRRNGEPSGLDFGNWLTIGHHWLGHGAPGGSTSTYPPLVPLLAVAAVKLFGISLGTGLLAAVAGCLPGFAVYWVLSRTTGPITATALGLVIAAAGSTGEAVAWGGVPQLLGLGFGLLVLWSLASLLHHPCPRAAWRTAGLLLATAATSHLILAQVAAAAAAVVALHLVFSRGGLSLRGPWRGRNGLLMHTVRVGGPALVLLPLYLRLSGSVGASFVGTTHSTSPIPATMDALSGLYTEAGWLWKTATVAALLAPVVFVRARRSRLWQLTAALVYTDVASIALTGQNRLAYLAPLAIALAFGLIWKETAPLLPTKPRAVVAALLLAGAGLGAQRGLQHFPAQRSYYGDRLVPPGTTAALDWVRTNTPRDALIAVAPEYGLPFGWWVEGYAQRPTLTGASEAFLNFPAERARAREAIELFSLTDVAANQFAAQARDLSVRYLFIPAGWGGLPASSVQRYLDTHPSAAVFHNSAALVVQIQP